MFKCSKTKPIISQPEDNPHESQPTPHGNTQHHRKQPDSSKNSHPQSSQTKPRPHRPPRILHCPKLYGRLHRRPENQPRNLRQNARDFSKKFPNKSATSIFSAAQSSRKTAANTTTPAPFGETALFWLNTRKLTPYKPKFKAGVAKGTQPLVVDTEFGQAWADCVR